MIKKPPEYLYHGTSKIYTIRILEKGLMKMGRNFVYMTPDINTAKGYSIRRISSHKYPYSKISQKIKDNIKNDPVIIKINAVEAFNNKVIFNMVNNNIWLSEFIDKRYLEVINL